MSLRCSLIHTLCVLVTILFSTFQFQQAFADVLTAPIEELITQGKLTEALLLTDKQLSTDSDNVSLLFLKGLIHTKRNELDQARKIFVQLTQNHPELPEPFNNLAVIYAAQGDFDNARNALQQAINTHPSYATAHENLGDIYAKMASKAYNQALELDDDNETARGKLLLVNNLFPLEATKSPPDDTGIAELEKARTDAADLEKSIAELRIQSRKSQESNLVLQAEIQKLIKDRDAELEISRQQMASLSADLNKSREELAAVRQGLAASTQEPQPQVARQEQETQPVTATLNTVVQPEKRNDTQTDKQDVIQALNDWAAAWSRQDVNGYLASYSGTFSPPGSTRANWTQLRRERIEAPQYIAVKISEIALTFVSVAEVRVKFFQEYKSDSYSDKVLKTLIMTKQSGSWLIEAEVAN